VALVQTLNFKELKMPTLRQSVQVARKDPTISADGYEPVNLAATPVTVT
jgi:hypothetical protein